MKTHIFFFVTFFLLQPAHAGQGNPDAHVHGAGLLTVVFERGQLLIELTTPAANMLGFEHHPKTKAQEKAVESLEQTLSQPGKVLSLQPSCQIKEIAVEMPFGTQDKQAELEDHHHHHKHEQHGVHEDIRTRYMWHCSTTTLPKITVSYFQLYPAFEKIRLEWIVDGSQGSTQLNTRENTFNMVK